MSDAEKPDTGADASGSCTWKGCTRKALYQQVSNDGEMWASLCAPHNAELKEAITGGKPKPLLHFPAVHRPQLGR